MGGRGAYEGRGEYICRMKNENFDRAVRQRRGRGREGKREESVAKEGKGTPPSQVTFSFIFDRFLRRFFFFFSSSSVCALHNQSAHCTLTWRSLRGCN